MLSRTGETVLEVISLQLAASAHLHVNAIFWICGFGLVLGMRHATDPDHLVALSTIVSRQRSVKQAALMGSLWGLGHTITIFLIGSLIILFGVRIPTRIGLAMEFCVAVMLVLLGLLNLTGVMRRIRESFGSAKQRSHQATHVVQTEVPSPTGGTGRIFQSAYIRPFAIGLTHGLAGSAAVALLVLSTIRNPLWATFYLLIFGVGTMFGMVLMTSAIALPITYGSKRFKRLNTHLATVSGVISICFGLFLMYELGFVGGLFGPQPHWTPS